MPGLYSSCSQSSSASPYSFLRVGHEIINRLWGVELADKLFMDAMTLLWMVLVGLTPIGLAIYAMMRLVRWFAGKKEP